MRIQGNEIYSSDLTIVYERMRRGDRSREKTQGLALVSPRHETTFIQEAPISLRTAVCRCGGLSVCELHQARVSNIIYLRQP